MESHKDIGSRILAGAVAVVITTGLFIGTEGSIHTDVTKVAAPPPIQKIVPLADRDESPPRKVVRTTEPAAAAVIEVKAVPVEVEQPAPKPKVQITRVKPQAQASVNGDVWIRIAQCESSGNWSINSGNGYYGGLQFDLPTWKSAGGLAYASRPDLATKSQQIAVAENLRAKRGYSPWECAGKLGIK